MRRVKLLATAAISTALVAVPTNAHAATLLRWSANDCTYAQMEYTAIREQGSSNYYITLRYAYIHWPNADAGCGPLGEPYSGVLQWKGIRNGQSFGWTAVPGGYMRIDGQAIPDISGGGYKDVRFRACNWNTNTGTVGTCGSS
ncbi:hypothetical protein [Streptomyces venetus]|uniref:hypothetical protein n=1 Tax=Streptomyces venetus TaxID=1701086 RepID=UPI003C2FB54B